MTRFAANGPRINYTPVQPTKPFKQIVGLYDMWQALSPDTRNWIAGLFKSDKDKMMDGPVSTERDPILDFEVTTGPSTYARDYDNVMEPYEGRTPMNIKVGATNPYNIDWENLLK